MRYIKLTTVDYSYEAMFLKDYLAREGINCIVTNENFTTLMPHLNGMLGAGIQILVDKEDFDRAKKLLDQRRGDAAVLTCPNCHSTNVRYGLGTKRRFQKIIALVIAALIATPVRQIKQIYYCRDCKTEFSEGL